MELSINNNFGVMDTNELQNLDGGLVIFGVIVSGALCAKIAAGAFTAGVTIAGIYYSTKK